MGLAVKVMHTHKHTQTVDDRRTSGFGRCVWRPVIFRQTVHGYYHVMFVISFV